MPVQPSAPGSNNARRTAGRIHGGGRDSGPRSRDGRRMAEDFTTLPNTEFLAICLPFTVSADAAFQRRQTLN
jgi:hypothetical protein